LPLPLDGLRVLDLSRALAGPYCAMILADLGADVVKIEPSPKGEMVRSWGPFADGISVYYLSIHRNKRSLALDFRKAEGLDLIAELTASADILVENFRPGAMEEMGLGYDKLKVANPRLIYANITGFGREGPYGDWPGVDQIAQGMSGLMSITGTADSGPIRVGLPVGDVCAGMWAALGIQAAVIDRIASGRGQRVETSLLAGLVGMLNLQGQRQLSLGDTPKRTGNDHPVICPYGAFEAKDGPFNMAVLTDDMWRKLCGLTGLDELVALPEFRENTSRMHNREEVKRRLNAVFASRTRLEWTRDLVKLGLPAGPIYGLADVFEDAQVKHWGMVETVAHPTLGDIKLLSSPLRLDSIGKQTVRSAPPLLGQHTHAVLRDFGISAERIAAMTAAGIVQVAEEAA
jgi:crotonobetainyl-CoA:carnitine CoA-transferase CaiB-like acyl-CoA transferase